MILHFREANKKAQCMTEQNATFLLIIIITDTRNSDTDQGSLTCVYYDHFACVYTRGTSVYNLI